MTHTDKKDKPLSGPTYTGSFGTSTSAGITSASAHQEEEGITDSASLFLKFKGGKEYTEGDKNKPSIPDTRNERYR